MSQIAFGNRNRSLRFDIDAMMALEAVSGKTTGEIIADLARLSMNSLVFALWAGLKHEDNSLSVKLVKKYLETYVTLPGASLKDLRKAVSDAIDESAWFQQLTADDAEDDDEAEDAAAEVPPGNGQPPRKRR